MSRLIDRSFMGSQYGLLIMCACVMLSLAWWSSKGRWTTRWTDSHSYVRVPPPFTNQMARRVVIFTTPPLIFPFTYIMMKTEKYRSPYNMSYIGCRIRYS